MDDFINLIIDHPVDACDQLLDAALVQSAGGLVNIQQQGGHSGKKAVFLADILLYSLQIVLDHGDRLFLLGVKTHA